MSLACRSNVFTKAILMLLSISEYWQSPIAHLTHAKWISVVCMYTPLIVSSQHTMWSNYVRQYRHIEARCKLSTSYSPSLPSAYYIYTYTFDIRCWCELIGWPSLCGCWQALSVVEYECNSINLNYAYGICCGEKDWQFVATVYCWDLSTALIGNSNEILVCFVSISAIQRSLFAKRNGGVEVIMSIEYTVYQKNKELRPRLRDWLST